MLIIFDIDILAIHKQFCNAETSVVFGLEVIKIRLGVLRERVFVRTCLIERISVVVPIQVRTHIAAESRGSWKSGQSFFGKFRFRKPLIAVARHVCIAAAFSAAFVARDKKNAARHDKRQAQCHNNNFLSLIIKLPFCLFDNKIQLYYQNCNILSEKWHKKTLRITARFKMERVTGIEPVTTAWEAVVLPLNYTRKQ